MTIAYLYNINILIYVKTNIVINLTDKELEFVWMSPTISKSYKKYWIWMNRRQYYNPKTCWSVLRKCQKKKVNISWTSEYTPIEIFLKNYLQKYSFKIKTSVPFYHSLEEMNQINEIYPLYYITSVYNCFFYNWSLKSDKTTMEMR